MGKYFLFIFCSFFSLTSFCQDFSNKGKDFWVGYGYHQQMTNGGGGGSQDMLLYFATDQVTNITVSIPGIGWTQTYTSPAGNNIITSASMPKFAPQDACLRAESITPDDKGIHITSDKPMVAYAHILNSSVSGATILYPTNTLGKEYYSVNYTNISNTADANCWFYVIATDTGTTQVEITPSDATINHPANIPFTVTLTQGQVYNIMGTFDNGRVPQQGVDLTGSRIRSLASNGSCKKIAVFSGSGRISLTCNGASSSSDNYMVQALPKTAWGKNYLTVPAAGYNNVANGIPFSYNLYRVCVLDPTTQVYIDGVLTALPLQNNFYYNIPVSNTTHSITADKPIMVAQYLPSRANCSNPGPAGDGDPEVIYLSPVEQSINKVTWNACRRAAINTNKHYVNVVIPNGGTAISSFRLDGINVAAANFTLHPQNNNYSYAVLNVAGTNNTGLSGIQHTIESDSGFNAIAYGFGSAESYGYNAGTNVKDLYQQIGVATQYGIETTPSVCSGSPFKFKISLPYQPLQLEWNLSGLPGPPANVTQVPTTIPPYVTHDSTTFISGKQIWWYSLPTFYSFTTLGAFPVSIIAQTTGADGCGNEQIIDFDLQVSPLPVADFTWTPNGCVAESVQFTETTPQTPKPTYNWWWNFGDPASGANNISTLRNPTHIFSSPGTYTVRYAAITTPGCLSDTIPHTIVIAPLPSATIAGTTAVCVNGITPNITFTATDGTAPYTFTYNINGGPNQTVNSITGNTATISVPTITAGTYTYNLVSVNNTGSSLCIQNQTGSAVVTVNPLPTATILGNTTVCLNDVSPNVTFTGTTGTAPFTFTYNINGGPAQTITTTTGNSVTVPVPTNTVGTFTYNLVSIQDGTSTACVQNVTGSVTIQVKELPTAIITGNLSVCQNAASPDITFTGANGSAPYTFTYNINGGPVQTVFTTAGNSVSVAVPTNISGTFTYNLLSVQEGSINNCNQVQSGNATVIVNPLPTAIITGTTTVCLNATSPDITFTGAGSTAPYTFTYNINGGPVQTVTTSAGNTVTVSAPTNIAGTFTYNLVSVQDGSSTLCNQVQTGSATIIVNSLPTASIAGTTAACLNGPSPVITFTGAVGTAPYTFVYNINGGPNQTITSTVGNSVTVAAPTTTVGTFIYNLISVQEGSTNGCLQNQSGSAIITVNPLPVATISGTTAVCLNAPMPNITFAGSGSTAPYTFTYNINGGPNQTVTTTTGNSVTIAIPTTTAGTYSYNLISVQDGSSTLCSQAQNGNAVITVYPLPTPNFNSSVPSCETRLITFTDISNPNVGTITSWAWDFGDPGSGVNNNSTVQNPSHIFNTAGNYNVSLTVTTSNGCSNAIPFINTVTVNARPLAGYIVPEVCLSDTYAQFLDTSKVALPGGVTAWEWNFGDPASGVNNTSTLQNPQHSYTATGSYNVVLIVTSNNGCKDTTNYPPLVVNGSFPTANFTVNNPTILCANDSVAIVEASTVFPGVITKVEIYWDNVNFPAVFQTDNDPFTGKVYKHLYLPNSQITRTYQIRYRAYSGGVCVNDRLSNITVNAAPLVQFNAIPDACLNAPPYQITQASEIGGVPGTYLFSGPGVSPMGMFNPTAAGVGIHTIQYTFTSTAGGCVDTKSRTINVLDTASAKFSFLSPVCEGNATTFKDESTAPLGVVLNNTIWNFGDGTPVETHAPGSTFTHIFPAWGNYTVTMYNTSAYGCRSTDKVLQVYVSPIPQTSFSFAQSSVCLPNAAVSFINNSTISDGTENAFTYLWNFGDPASGVLNTSSAKNPQPHIYSGTGPYFVDLTVTSGSNCVRKYTDTVDFIHPQPKAAFDFNKPSVCIGDDVIFRDLTNGLDGTVVQWNWTFSDGTTGNRSQEQHLFTAAKTYDVSLFIVNSQGCNSDTITQQFTVHPFPVVDAGPNRVVLQGGSITIQPNVTGNDLQYLWSPNTYLNNTSLATPTASNMQDDIRYTLVVTARGGCKNSDTMFVKVLKAPVIPNTFTPNGDGINEFWKIEYLDTYPNNRVQVFTRTGQLVFESRGYKQPWNGTFNGKPLPFDTYYYIIEPENGRKPITGYVTIIK